MPDNSVFYLVFPVQIFLISYFFPKKILARVRYVFDTHPPEEFPKLYPRPIAHYQRGQNTFRLMNNLILVIGLMLLVAIGTWDALTDGFVSEAIPVVFFFVQWIPLFILEFSEFAYFRQMRAADSRSTRQAGLQPRRLFDFVSPQLVGFAVFMLGLSVAVDICVNQHIHEFSFNWSHGTVQRTLNALFINLFFDLACSR